MPPPQIGLVGQDEETVDVVVVVLVQESQGTGDGTVVVVVVVLVQESQGTGDGTVVVVVVVFVQESHGTRDGTVVVSVVVSVLNEVKNSLLVSVITSTEPVYIVEVVV